MALTSTGWARRDGDLLSGVGTVTLESGDAAGPLDVTWKARTEEHGGLTSPEELIDAAHASCFSIALSNDLASAGTATSLDTTATTNAVACRHHPRSAAVGGPAAVGPAW